MIAKSTEGLQCMLNELHEMCRRWRLLINTKVKIFAFSKKVGQGQRILNLPFGQISWEQLI